LEYLQMSGQNMSSIIDAVDDNNYTPLHYACIHRSHRAVHLLINYHADVSIPTKGDKTCLHLSAEKLDDKSLSTILSSGGGMDPNVLDGEMRTPMYVAICDGKTVGDKLDSEALNRCLAALDVWGGQIFFSNYGLVHPVHMVAREWRFLDLEVVLARCCPFTRPIFPIEEEEVCSIGYYCDYPLHFVLISFYENVVQFTQEEDIVMKEKEEGQQEITSFGTLADKLLYTQYYDLCKTLKILLEYGFEPNERCLSRSQNNTNDTNLMLFYGYTPLQILAIIATYCHQKIQDVDKLQMKEFLFTLISQAAKVLILNGGRINVDAPPPIKKVNRQSSTGSSDSLENHEQIQTVISESGIDRSTLKLDENHSLIALLGGIEYFTQTRTQWDSIKTIANPGSTAIRLQKDISPTLGTDKCCTICWKAFGKILNRKHTCRASGRYICEECSCKRILMNREDYRISDGVYNLARKEKSTKQSRDVEAKQRKTEARQNRIKELKEERFGIAANTTKKYEEDISKEDQDRNTLFGNISKQVQNMFVDEEEDKMERQKGELSSLANSVSQTRDAFLERGQKLNTLSDKTDALREASKGFADMARELNESQKGFFW